MSLRKVRRLIADRDIRYVDFRFADLLGGWRHITYAVEAFDEEMFVKGIGFDGSSVRGFQGIEDSDMLLRPDPTSVFVDPFYKDPTMVFLCNVKDPVTLSLYSRDPRHIAEKATRFLNSSAIADTCYVGPEAEFYIFDEARFDQTVNEAFYRVDSAWGGWATGRDEQPNLGHKPRLKQGYFRMPPTDPYQDVRSHMVSNLRGCGVDAELHHQEVGSGGQSEIGLKYQPLIEMSDAVMKFKYTVKNTAHQHGKTATFMPKPLFGDNGSGMHCHVSLWRDGKNLFYDADGYAGLSDSGRWFIGGILRHAGSLLAFTCPTANSYRRLVPGFEAPVKLVYSQRNRSAAVRIPMYSAAAEAKRIEFRCPRSKRESLSRVLGDPDGRSGRHPGAHRAARSGGPGHLRAAGGRAAEDRRYPADAQGGAPVARDRQRVSAARRCVHPRMCWTPGFATSGPTSWPTWTSGPIRQSSRSITTAEGPNADSARKTDPGSRRPSSMTPGNIGIAIALGTTAIMAIILFIKTHVVVCAPNEAMIFSGRKRGFRVIRGGRGFRRPLVETVSRISLNTIPIEVKVQKALSAGMISLDVEGLATVKISADTTAG